MCIRDRGSRRTAQQQSGPACPTPGPHWWWVAGPAGHACGATSWGTGGCRWPGTRTCSACSYTHFLYCPEGISNISILSREYLVGPPPFTMLPRGVPKLNRVPCTSPVVVSSEVYLTDDHRRPSSDTTSNHSRSVHVCASDSSVLPNVPWLPRCSLTFLFSFASCRLPLITLPDEIVSVALGVG